MKKLLSLIAVLIMALSLCACGTPSPSETVDTFLTAVKAQDSDSLKSVYGEDFSFVGATDYAEGDLETLLIEKLTAFDYEITGEKIDGDKATVTVEFTTYPIGEALKDSMEDYLTEAFTLAFTGASDEQIQELFFSIFEEELTELTEKDYNGTADITLTQTDDGWEIDTIPEEGEFLNVLFGGLYDAVTEIDKAFAY